MALQGEMRILVGDLELAGSRRAQEERERRETAALDARRRAGDALGRGREERERRETAALDARRRAGDALGRGREERERRETASLDARGRAMDALGRAREERERRETASLDARGRAARTASRRVEVSERLSGLHQERATVARDARGLGAGMVGLRGALDGGRRERDARDAAERAVRIAALRGEVAGTLGRFQRDRAVQAAWDEIGRVEDERDRQVTAAQDARERATEISGLGRIWSDHVGTMESLR